MPPKDPPPKSPFVYSIASLAICLSSLNGPTIRGAFTISGELIDLEERLANAQDAVVTWAPEWERGEELATHRDLVRVRNERRLRGALAVAAFSRAQELAPNSLLHGLESRQHLFG